MTTEFNFFFPSGRGSQTTGSLIQGLHTLGYPTNSNISLVNNLDSNAAFPPFGSSNPDYVNVTNNFSSGILVVDVTHGWGKFEQSLVARSKNNKIILINMHDVVNMIDYDEKFIVFSPHQNLNAQRKGNIFPLSNISALINM